MLKIDAKLLMIGRSFYLRNVKRLIMFNNMKNLIMFIVHYLLISVTTEHKASFFLRMSTSKFACPSIWKYRNYSKERLSLISALPFRREIFNERLPLMGAPLFSEMERSFDK